MAKEQSPTLSKPKETKKKKVVKKKPVVVASNEAIEPEVETEEKKNIKLPPKNARTRVNSIKQ